MDRISINNLEVFANHGVYPEENTLGQKFLVSAVLYTDIHAAGISDKLEKSIDYGKVCHHIYEIVKNSTFALLERLAEQIARELLLNYDTYGVQVEVKKPWAPIGLPLDYASVCINRKWHTAYIGIGSNMGDKEAYLNMACRRIARAEDCRLIAKSDYIVTKPVGGVEQDDFLNGALMVNTLFTPDELLEFLQGIEKEAKRERLVHWGPRTLDLDILFYDNEIISTDRLTIPHREMHKRLFAAEPMAQLAPYYIHPIYGRTMADLYAELSGDTIEE